MAEQKVKIDRPLVELLQEVRYEMSKAELKKSGYNPWADFYYFELKDFLPKATELFYQRGICPVMSIYYDSNGIETATLKMTKGTEQIQFIIPTSQANNSNNPIQNRGSQITYLRRYLYVMALDLTEDDGVDAADNSQKEVKAETTQLATEKQVELIKGLYDEENIQKIKEYYKVENLEQLTIKQASQVISKKKEKNNG